MHDFSAINTFFFLCYSDILKYVDNILYNSKGIFKNLQYREQCILSRDK